MGRYGERMEKPQENSTAYIARLGMFTALAALMGYVESLIPVSVAVPGVKLGLCNIVIVYILYRMGWREALAVSVVRVFLIAFLFGNMVSLIYSMTGTMAALAGMTVLKKTGAFSVYGVSAAGGALHGTGQILAAFILLQDAVILRYLSVLLISGTLTGLLIAFAAARVLRLTRAL